MAEPRAVPEAACVKHSSQRPPGRRLCRTNRPHRLHAGTAVPTLLELPTKSSSNRRRSPWMVSSAQSPYRGRRNGFDRLYTNHAIRRLASERLTMLRTAARLPSGYPRRRRLICRRSLRLDASLGPRTIRLGSPQVAYSHLRISSAIQLEGPLSLPVPGGTTGPPPAAGLSVEVQRRPAVEPVSCVLPHVNRRRSRSSSAWLSQPWVASPSKRRWT